MNEPVRRYAPATERNKAPILATLREALPASGLVLEIASGTGEHAVFFAEHLPALRFQPSDVDPEAITSINAWLAHAKLPNVSPPLVLDVTAELWPVEHADAIFNANMIHISPIEACHGLMQGATRVLAPGGLLFLYGPFRVNGAHTSPSNERFDQSLRERNPAWGVRDLEAVVEIAQKNGLLLDKTIAMPANNLSLIFRRS